MNRYQIVGELNGELFKPFTVYAHNQQDAEKDALEKMEIDNPDYQDIMVVATLQGAK